MCPHAEIAAGLPEAIVPSVRSVPSDFGWPGGGCREHRRSSICTSQRSASCFLSRRSSFKTKQGFMTIEQAIAHSLSKPWGVVDPRPWSSAGCDHSTIGEIWYERSGAAVSAPALLLKLLLTSQPLSIQVHGDLGLPSGAQDVPSFSSSSSSFTQSPRSGDRRGGDDGCRPHL